MHGVSDLNLYILNRYMSAKILVSFKEKNFLSCFCRETTKYLSMQELRLITQELPVVL